MSSMSNTQYVFGVGPSEITAPRDAMTLDEDERSSLERGMVTVCMKPGAYTAVP